MTSSGDQNKKKSSLLEGFEQTCLHLWSLLCFLMARSVTYEGRVFVYIRGRYWVLRSLVVGIMSFMGIIVSAQLKCPLDLKKNAFLYGGQQFILTRLPCFLICLHSFWNISRAINYYIASYPTDCFWYGDIAINVACFGVMWVISCFINTNNKWHSSFCIVSTVDGCNPCK